MAAHRGGGRAAHVMMPSPRRHLGSSRLQPPLVAIGRAPQVLSALAAMLAGVMHRAAALDNGLGLTSPLGFNSWNHFGCHINESLVLEVADHFESSGMAAAGYKCVAPWPGWLPAQACLAACLPHSLLQTVCAAMHSS